MEEKKQGGRAIRVGEGRRDSRRGRKGPMPLASDPPAISIQDSAAHLESSGSRQFVPKQDGSWPGGHVDSGAALRSEPWGP